ncbi:hypothetical protein [Candidatus Methanomassiliicoccus intestinalis]|nr:hypothetical protein [Candidatus Methanomassiliicoccus intestinalis]
MITTFTHTLYINSTSKHSWRKKSSEETYLERVEEFMDRPDLVKINTTSD